MCKNVETVALAASEATAAAKPDQTNPTTTTTSASVPQAQTKPPLPPSASPSPETEKRKSERDARAQKAKERRQQEEEARIATIVAKGKTKETAAAKQETKERVDRELKRRASQKTLAKTESAAVKTDTAAATNSKPTETSAAEDVKPKKGGSKAADASNRAVEDEQCSGCDRNQWREHVRVRIFSGRDLARTNASGSQGCPRHTPSAMLVHQPSMPVSQTGTPQTGTPAGSTTLRRMIPG